MRRSHLLILFLVLATPNFAVASWIAGGVPVTDLGNNARPLLTPDGSGGVIVAWDIDNDIYAQRVDQDGNLVWGASMPVCVCTGYQTAMFIVTDGAGGAIVGWSESPVGADYGIGAARLDGSGQVLWTRLVATGLDYPWLVSHMISDGAGGALFAWTDSHYDAYAQRVDSNGQLLWGANGMRINGGGTWGQFRPQVVLDGGGKVFVVWGDERRSYYDDGPPFHKVTITDIYGQRLTLDGQQEWASDGKSLLEPGNTDPDWSMVTGATDGILMTNRTSTLRAGRLSSNGDLVWGDVPVCEAAGEKRYPGILTDGADGSLITWNDSRSGTPDVYAQRLDANGNPMWATDGVMVAGGAGDQSIYRASGDGTGGVIELYGQAACCGLMRLQRLDQDAQKPWGNDGVLISDIPVAQTSLVLDGDHVFCAWVHMSNGPNQVFLQRFNVADGSWGSTVAVAISSFEARAVGMSIRLEATFQSDFAVEHINIYRGARNASMLRLTEAAAGSPQFTYVDAAVMPGETYRYQIGVIDRDGEFLSPVQTVTVPRATTSLEQNSPNPFNPGTTIHFSLAARERAQLDIYSADGRLVRRLLDATRNPGSYQVNWDGRDDRGATVTSGVYFYRLTAGKFSDSRRMVLLK